MQKIVALNPVIIIEIIPGVFNNAMRSSTITVQSLETLYECLQKFGRICAEVTEFVTIMPGEVIIDYMNICFFKVTIFKS